MDQVCTSWGRQMEIATELARHHDDEETRDLPPCPRSSPAPHRHHGRFTAAPVPAGGMESTTSAATASGGPDPDRGRGVMTSTAGTVVAVLAGLGAGWAFGTGVALQSRQARLAPAAGKGPVRLLAHLARQRVWLAGIALATSAYGLQALPLAARWSGRPMRRRDWAGCVLTGCGIAVFLAASPPSAGRSDAPAADWVLAFAVVTLVAAGAVTAAIRIRGPARAGLLAVAAGT